jgi:hypothetical protein
MVRVAAAYECRIHGARRIVLVAGAPTAPTICHNLMMCARYRLSRRKQMIEEYFDSVSGDDDWNPRYNIAPTQPVPVIRQNPKEPRRELSLMRCGLIPSWAKDMSGAAMMINARSETAATKPAFRDPLTSRRWLLNLAPPLPLVKSVCVLFRSQRRRVVCIRRTVERPERTVD